VAGPVDLGGRRVEEPAGRGSDRRGGWSRPPPSTPPLQPAALPPRTRRKAGPAQKQRDGDAPLRLSSPVRDAPQNEHTRLVAAREKPRPLRNALLDGPDTRPI